MSWLLASLAVLAFGLAAGVLWYERSHPSSRVLALVATLAALAALGRIAFAPLPNVKPTTDIVLLAGYVLGGAPGFMVGAVAALASNLFFGQGPWTPWQMAAWGLVGIAGALLARAAGGRDLGRTGLAIACVAAGFLYGAVMNLFLWVTFSGDHTSAKLWAYVATSLPFDVAHSLGNAAFCLAFGPVMVRALRRYRARMEVSWRPAPAAASVAAAIAVAVALAGMAVPSPARAAAPRASVNYLLNAQNRDGGFGGAPGQRSSQMQTGWAALGLAAAGHNPLDVTRSRRSVVDYVRAHAGALRGDLGERTRTVLMLRAAGVSARSFAGRDLVAEILAAQRNDGSFAGRVNTTAFAVLAMRAAGLVPRHPRVRAAGRFIAGQPNPDGGFNFAGRGGSSGVDDTGAALQALAAAGRRRTAVAGGAARFLRAAQNRDGGFPLQPGGSSNAQSTSWAVQALIAVGDDPARLRAGGSRTPLQYLRALVGSDGAVRYSRTSTQTPVWVTAQAVTALAGEAFPLDRVPRRRAARGSGARAASHTGSQASGGAPEPATRTSRPGGLRGGRGDGMRSRSGGQKARGRSSLVGWTPYASLPELADRAHAAGIVVATFAWPLS